LDLVDTVENGAEEVVEMSCTQMGDNVSKVLRQLTTFGEDSSTHRDQLSNSLRCLGASVCQRLDLALKIRPAFVVCNSAG
jgi:hypothetical protein